MTHAMVFHNVKMGVTRSQQFVRCRPRNLHLRNISIFVRIWILFLLLRTQLSDTNPQGSKYLIIVTVDLGTINNFKAFPMVGALPSLALGPWQTISTHRIRSILTTM
jgi:hypothetical protein